MFGKEDILGLEFGEKPRLPFHQVIRLRAPSESTRHAAWEIMFGLGSTTLLVSAGGAERLLMQIREALERPITDESFRSFPFIFPQIGRALLEKAYPSQMSAWLGETELYIRESEEDKAVLVLSTKPLGEELGAAGFFVPAEPETQSPSP